jgi:hypothetical protein
MARANSPWHAPRAPPRTRRSCLSHTIPHYATSQTNSQNAGALRGTVAGLASGGSRDRDLEQWFGVWVRAAGLRTWVPWDAYSSRSGTVAGAEDRLRDSWPDQAGLIGEDHGLDAVAELQLGQQVGDVALDRGVADE